MSQSCETIGSSEAKSHNRIAAYNLFHFISHYIAGKFIQQYQKENCCTTSYFARWTSLFLPRTEVYFYLTKQINLTEWTLDQCFPRFLECDSR